MSGIVAFTKLILEWQAIANEQEHKEIKQPKPNYQVYRRCAAQLDGLVRQEGLVTPRILELERLLKTATEDLEKQRLVNKALQDPKLMKLMVLRAEMEGKL